LRPRNGKIVDFAQTHWQARRKPAEPGADPDAAEQNFVLRVARAQETLAIPPVRQADLRLSRGWCWARLSRWQLSLVLAQLWLVIYGYHRPACRAE
jgi:hypothetical protein